MQRNIEYNCSGFENRCYVTANLSNRFERQQIYFRKSLSPIKKTVKIASGDRNRYFNVTGPLVSVIKRVFF